MDTFHSLQRQNFTDGWFMEKGGVLMTRVRGAGRQNQGPKSRVIFSAFAISRQRQELDRPRQRHSRTVLRSTKNSCHLPSHRHNSNNVCPPNSLIHSPCPQHLTATRHPLTMTRPHTLHLPQASSPIPGIPVEVYIRAFFEHERMMPSREDVSNPIANQVPIEDSRRRESHTTKS